MGETCGILPVGVDQAMVRTEGLKWDLGERSVIRFWLSSVDWVTSFDGQISTSNHLVPSEPLVHITTSRPIMWCIEVKGNLPSLSPHGMTPGGSPQDAR